MPCPYKYIELVPRLWEPMSRGSASQAAMKIRGRASGVVLPGRAW